MRVVLGVLEADSGSVIWDGSPITFETRRRIGYIPEDRGLYPKMSVIAQLVYFAQLHGLNRKAAREASTALLERLGLADRAKSQLQSLSHGNQQRVQLAAALVFSPDLLVLDEPFAGLDPVAVDAMTDDPAIGSRCGETRSCSRATSSTSSNGSVTAWGSSTTDRWSPPGPWTN